MTRTVYVIANWKMHGDRQSNKALLNDIKKEGAGADVNVLIAAPYLYLQQLSEELEGTGIEYGAQNVSEFESGAYTGEISAAMLSDLSCSFALVGHSERRQIFHEHDELTANKFDRLLSHGLTPVLCVGETLEQRESGDTEQCIQKQLKAVLDRCGIEAFKKAIIAYEPVWAIGTGKTASPEQAQEIHAGIRTFLSGYDADIASGVTILYGGSVNENNAQALFEQEDIDGGLVGGASLKAESFTKIMKVVQSGNG